jgi:hypothetical protein
MNFCAEPEWLAFRIVDGRVAWETPTDDESLSRCVENPIREKAAVLHEVIDWLRDLLGDEDQPASAVLQQARECGYSQATLRRACIKAKVRHIRCDYGPMEVLDVDAQTPATGGRVRERHRAGEEGAFARAPPRSARVSPRSARVS